MEVGSAEKACMIFLIILPFSLFFFSDFDSLSIFLVMTVGETSQLMQILVSRSLEIECCTGLH